MAAADLDGDGYNDLAVVNAGVVPETVSLLLNKGGENAGEFRLADQLSVDPDQRCVFDPVSVALADLNGDGHIDLAVANKNRASVSLLLSYRPNLDCNRPFIRGECNNDGVVDLSDAISNLNFLFLGTFDPSCLDACDFNDDGNVDIADAISSLSHQFLGAPPPPPPGKACGDDPTPDDLGCASSTCPDDTADSFQKRLARRWAPIHYQIVHVAQCDAGAGGKSDYITAVDYDGDWFTANNWDNVPNYPLTAHCYYSVVSSATHWFLIYAFYHPRDWSRFECSGGGPDSHENDLEGMLTVVRRPTSPADDEFGSIEAMVTVFHSDFYSYDVAQSSFSEGQEDIDGRLRLEMHEDREHPVTTQEAEGHGLRAGEDFGVGNGLVRYVPGDVAEEPPQPSGPTVTYRLVDIFEPGGLWKRRYDSQTFVDGEKFLGDDGAGVLTNKANAPWAWDDGDDGDQLLGGELAVDPIKLVRIYFNIGDRPFSLSYEDNRYRGVEPPPPGLLRLQTLPLSFIPPLTSGDRDYHGHGPRVDLSSTIQINGDRRAIEAQVWMKAEEWDGDGCSNGSPQDDYTTAEGTSSWMPIAFAPPGKRIQSILSATSSSCNYCFVDSDHEDDSHLIGAGGLVQRYEVVGDTDGDEAGTKTGVTVFFNTVHVEVEDAPEDRTGTLTAFPLPYTPPHKDNEGDEDYDGNGPRVELETFLQIRGDGEAVEARVWMKAEEWEGNCAGGEAHSDYTTAEGYSSWATIALAPPGRRISRILSPAVASGTCYVDDDHELDRIDGNGPVDRYEVTGDTDGDEAGTRTGVMVFFNGIDVELE